MDESSGKGSKMQAHKLRFVVMDIAAFKVGHSVDIDATALQAKSGARNVPSGRWNVTHGFDSRGTGGNVAEGSKGEHSAQKHILL
jgi:hypothetical protein